MEEIIIFFMNEYGYLGILLLIMIENVFPPIPSEIILGFGGFMTKTTNLTLFGVILVSTIGSCLGAVILYFLGYIIKKERLVLFTKSRFGKFLGFKEDDIEKADNWFVKHGTISILLGRFIPIIRSLISIPAGISKINFFKFISFTFIGTLIWNTILSTIGRILGNNWYKIGLFMDKYSKVVLIILICLVIIMIIVFFSRKYKKLKKS